MRALVTGVAGFIGSHLAERLAHDGWDVCGIDSFTSYYDPTIKRSNIRGLLTHPRFVMLERDLSNCALEDLLEGVDVVFHQAGQPGVRLSWADQFAVYNELNVNVTQRLLEAVRHSSIGRLVFASSSSVYGDAQHYPTSEDDALAPNSPYGVTKLSAEFLCRTYARNFGVPVVALRYFTVYGPRQRPDMATHRMIEAARHRSPFTVFGDGTQIRDFTFVDDVVEANVAAALATVQSGTVLNIAGGGQTSVREVIDTVGEFVGAPVPVVTAAAAAGDVQRTGGDTRRATELLGWRPRVTIHDGIARQVEWHMASLDRR